jgi:Arc/MetJ-type ribon-helix-helix transcriptional regulator
MGDARQINVRFDGPVLRQLQELVDSTGKTLSEVLREAVNTSHWLNEQKEKGKKILIQGEEDDHPVQVILR